VAIEYVAAVLRGVFGLDPTAKLILLIVAEYARASSGGVAWPSVATIAREAGISERRTQIHLHRLREDRWLAVVGDARGGSGHSTRYKINLDRMRAAMKGDVGVTVSKSEKGDPGVTVLDVGTVTGTSKNGDGGSKNGDGETPETVMAASPEPEVAVYQPGSSRSPETRSTPVDKRQVEQRKAQTDKPTELQRRIEQLAEQMKARAAPTLSPEAEAYRRASRGE
jgi:hypothetical protein